MTKILLVLPNGAKVQATVSEEALAQLTVAAMSGQGARGGKSTLGRKSPTTRKGIVSQGSPAAVADLGRVVSLVRTCAEASKIKQKILDTTSEKNRVMAILYVVRKYVASDKGLTTTELSTATTTLNVRISRQNCLRAIQNARGFIYTAKRGRRIWYILNPRGAKYIEAILAAAPSRS